MKQYQKVLAFIALAIACFLTVLDGTIVNVSLPEMAKYFGTGISGISWVSTAYLIPFSALLINFSKIADIFGRKRLFIIGLIIFGAASICCGLATSLWMMITFRIIQGIGAAILTPLAVPLGIELFGKGAMGKLAIIIGMIISIAAASGPVIGGVLNETYGFKSIFYVNLPFIIIAAIFGLKYVRECYDKSIQKKVDLIGSVLLGYGLGALTFSLVKGNDYGWNSPIIISLFASVAVALTFFAIYESKVSYPMIETKLFHIKSYSSSIILIAVIFFAYIPVSYLMNFYLESGMGFSVLKSGLILGIASAVAFVMSPVFGVVAKLTSAKVVSFIAISCASVGDMILVFMNSGNHMKVIYASFIVLGIGLGATAPLYQSAFEEVSEDKNGIASGILNSLRQLTACLAIALVATLSSQFTTTAIEHTKDKVMNLMAEDEVLAPQVKASISEVLSKAGSDSNNELSKETISNMLQKQETSFLATVPEDSKDSAKQKFETQKKEIYQLLDQTIIIKGDETNKVYNKCFLITGIITAFGLIAVPFNKKRAAESVQGKKRIEILSE